MKRRLHIILVFLLLFSVRTTAQEEGVSRDTYLEYAERMASLYIADLDSTQKAFRDALKPDPKAGYRPPNSEIYLAALCANLYSITGKNEYADAAAEMLFEFGDHKKLYPPGFQSTQVEYEHGLPAVPHHFSFRKYVHAYHTLNRSNKVPAEYQQTIEQNIAEGADHLLRWQEWGPMNRAMLCAEGLCYAAKAVPGHSNSKKWKEIGEIIAADNLNNWSIEDSDLYNTIWLLSLVGYASDVMEDDQSLNNRFIHYYGDYFLQLTAPNGLTPDFGDSDWRKSYARQIAVFEKLAAVFKEPKYRWAAKERMKHYDLSKTNVQFAMVMSEIIRWADFDLSAIQPTNGSTQILDDQIGKKIVFRDGWKPDDSYLLLNYKDEGHDGRIFKDYLRSTRMVKEEKMHHGHADENSITFLMKNGTVLLHDGGYRSDIPSGPNGEYRADYFHNRIIARRLGDVPNHYEAGSLFDRIKGSGTYKPVITEKVDFLTNDQFDYSRTRTIDNDLMYEHDRIITFIKELDWFVVFDVVTQRSNEPVLLANLWHTRKILSKGKYWYDTEYDSLRGRKLQDDASLAIIFPAMADWITTNNEPINRHHHREEMIYQSVESVDSPMVFVTVLAPHEKGIRPEELARKVQLIGATPNNGVAVQITDHENIYLIGAKLDLRKGEHQEGHRPRYSWDSGKIDYGLGVTDASHVFLKHNTTSLSYALVNASGFERNGKMVVEQPETTFRYATDGTPDHPGRSKVRLLVGEAPLR